MHAPNLQALLAKTFEFSEQDIAANQSGRMTPNQWERMVTKHYANTRLAWVALAVIFGIGFIGFFAEMVRLGTLDAFAMQVFLGMAVLFCAITGLGVVYYRRQLKRTLIKNDVQTVSGAIAIIAVRVEKLITWYFCVGQVRFRIEKARHRIQLQQSGIEGRQATAYYSTPWVEVLSVQLLSQENFK